MVKDENLNNFSESKINIGQQILRIFYTLFKCIAVALKGSQLIESKPGEHLRSIVYPDVGIRNDIEKLFSSFDPFNLSVELREHSRSALYLPFNITKARDLTMQGSFNDVKRLVKDKLFLLNSEERLNTILQVTNGLHELRHFHDYFGTTCGFARLLQVINDGMEFNKMWDQLRELGWIKLPLVKWGKTANAPEVLKRYLEKRRSYIEWLNWFDGSSKPMKLNGTSHLIEVPLVFNFGGDAQTIISTPFNLIQVSNGKKYHKLMPLGLYAILEGTACIIQRIAAREVFGERYAKLLKQKFLLGDKDDDYFPYYMIVDLYLSKRLIRFYEKYQLALSDISMMAEEPLDRAEGHPGLRLSKVTSAAKAIGLFHQKDDVDLAEYMNKITDKLGWKSIEDVAKEAIDKGNLVLKRLENGYKAKERWQTLLRAIYLFHLFFMTGRAKAIDILAEPMGYFHILDSLLLPPSFKKGIQIYFQGVGHVDSTAFLDWFCFEHMQRQLLFSTKLPCPGGKGTHVCPGDPLSKRRWRPNDRCYFSQLLVQMGLPELEVGNC